MNWQRVENMDNWWTCRESDVVYHLRLHSTGWTWSAFAPCWVAQSTQDGTKANMKSQVEAFAAMVRGQNMEEES